LLPDIVSHLFAANHQNNIILEGFNLSAEPALTVSAKAYVGNEKKKGADIIPKWKDSRIIAYYAWVEFCIKSTERFIFAYFG